MLVAEEAHVAGDVRKIHQFRGGVKIQADRDGALEQRIDKGRRKTE
jgi:hypothetical protein